MTKRIEEVLNLPSMDELEDDNVDQFTQALDANSEKLMQELSDPLGVTKHDDEMNQIYDSAIQAHKDLIDLGFNMEPKNAGSIMEPAARMLEIALKASQSKIDTKLKVSKLQMDREKLDKDLKKFEEDGDIDDDIGKEGSYVASRDEVLRKLREKRNQ